MAQGRGIHGVLHRVVAIEGQNSYNADPSSMGGVKLPVNNIGLASDRNLITPGTLRGRRDPAAPAQGFVDAGGAVVVPVDHCAIGYWLQMLLGYPETTSIDANLKYHRFTVNSVLDSFVMEKGFSDVAAYEKFGGCKCAGMQITIGGDEELVATFDIKAANATPAGASVVTPSTEISLARFNQFHASLTEGGASQSKVRTLELNVLNNLDESVYTIGGGASRGGLPEGFCNVNGRMEMMFENWSYYLYAFSGTERSLELTFASGSFQLIFSVDELLYRRRSPAIETPEGIYQDLEFEAYYTDAGSQSTIRATLINTWASYSAQP
jgi:hypothetical protein